MSSWLGACMIAGCAIGATGIVIHHYSSSVYQIPPKITYMINEEEWVQGVVDEFNRKLEELNFDLSVVSNKEQYGKNDSALEVYKNKPELHRSKCVSMMADAYRKEKEEEVKAEILKVFEEHKCPSVIRQNLALTV